MKYVSPRKVFRREILSGWKDIASYLGKAVRTVQRYEQELSLPVRRPTGKSAASVIATKAELDGWIAAAPVRKVFQLSQDSAGKNAIETRAAIDELKRHVQELRRLRQESAELRAALHESVDSLRKTLHLSLIEKTSSDRPDRAAVLSFPSKTIQ